MSRLFLGIYAASRGFSVIIGSQQKIIDYINDLPKGIFFYKILSLNKSEFYKKLVSNGFKVCSLDEEGLSSLNNYQKYVTQRVSKQTIKYAERIFTWGKSEADIIINQYPEATKKVRITGNPRIDLLKSNYDGKYMEDASKYNTIYGKYIFFPSNFTVNHALGKNNLIKLFNDLGRISSVEDEAYYNARLDYFNRTFKEFVSLVIETAKKFNNKNIIVRPHPSEDRSYWDKVTKDYNNIYIKSNDEAAGWIKGASVIIHSSCTTGLEAFVSNKPVIAFLPYKDHEYSKHISNRVSIECRTEKDVINKLKSIINDNEVDILIKDKRSMLSNHVKNINNNDAFKSIVSELEKIKINNEDFNGISANLFIRSKSIIRLLKTYFFDKKTFNYGRQKFPGITKKEFEKVFNELKKILNVNKSIRAKQISKDLFIVK